MTQGGYAIHTDALDFHISSLLEQQLFDGSWAPCAFYSQKLEGEIRYGPEGEALCSTGQMAWSVRERGTYALVSRLLKFRAGYQGVTSLFSRTTSPSSHGTRRMSVLWLDPRVVAPVGMIFVPGTTLLLYTSRVSTMMSRTG